MTRFKLPVIDHRSPVGVCGYCLAPTKHGFCSIDCVNKHAARRPPPTRGHCIAGNLLTGSHADRMTGRKRCEAYGCRSHNLDIIESESMPGRRHSGLAPPATLRGSNTNASSPSCSLDVAANGETNCHRVADIMGESKRRIEQIIASWRREHSELAEMSSAILDE